MRIQEKQKFRKFKQKKKIITFRINHSVISYNWRLPEDCSRWLKICSSITFRTWNGSSFCGVIEPRGGQKRNTRQNGHYHYNNMFFLFLNSLLFYGIADLADSRSSSVCYVQYNQIGFSQSCIVDLAYSKACSAVQTVPTVHACR